MKITALETIQLTTLPNLLWVHVHTDQGLIGLGETFRGADAVAAYIHSFVAPYLIGKDPLQIERHSRYLLNPYVGFASSGSASWAMRRFASSMRATTARTSG